MRKRKARFIAAVSILVMLAAGGLGSEQLPHLPDEGRGGTVPAALARAPLPASLRASVERLLRARRYSPAEQVLVQATSRSPNSSPLLTLLGDIFFLDGKYLNCAVAMKKADALRPIDQQSRFTLAMAYIAMKHSNWARPELEKLAREHPGNALYPYWISRVDYHDMRLGEAVSNVEKAIQLNPRFIKAYDNLGLYEEGLGRYRQAIDAYHEAIRLSKDQGIRSPWPALNLGALLAKLGHLKEAEACLRESLSEAPEFPKAHFQLGLLLAKENRDTEAVQELKKAIAYDSTYPEPYFILGKIYERQHALERARASFRMFQELKAQRQSIDLAE